MDAFLAQLRQSLDTHLGSLTEHYDKGIAEARRAATEEAEQKIAERLHAAELASKTRLDAELASARHEAERRLDAEVKKARGQAEQQAAESTARVRQEFEAALAAEKQQAAESTARVRQELEAALAAETQRAESLVQEHQSVLQERQRAQSELDGLRREVRDLTERLEQATRTRTQAEDARKQAEDNARTHADAHSAAQAELARHVDEQKRQPKVPAGTGLNVVDGLRAIDASRTLTEALEKVLRHTSAIAPRAAVFLVNGARLRSWKTIGFPQFEMQPFESAITGTGLLAQAIQTGEPAASSPSEPPPTFAALPGDLASVVIPVLVGGRAVALVYADNAAKSDISPAWRDAIEGLVRHASTHLALLTALRTVQAMGVGAPVGTGGAVSPDNDSHDQSARRYARLLVSEIKLYNEAAVHAGRQQRDLLRRLRPEIDRARRLYEERISGAAGARGTYFQQELVQTLADGDPALLGNA
jgi:chemotaxis protein histidine kinase CheA